MPPMKMPKQYDPCKPIWEAIGDLSGFEVMHNDVLIAVFIRPNTIEVAGGKINPATGKPFELHISDKTQQEDEFQGKAGMVLKKGPLAFVSDDNFDFKGQNVEPGEWIAIWVSDGRKIKINGVLCRMVEDRHIRMKIPAPDLVF